jgi:hypothetical protein
MSLGFPGLSIAWRSNVMNYLYKVATISLAVFPIWGESPAHRYTGHIVNARCLPAAEIVSRNSRGYSPSAAVNALVSGQHKPLNTLRLRKTILRRCAVNVGVTEFALLDSGGNFLRLDLEGNAQVFAQNIRDSKATIVRIEGNVDRTTLHVVTLSKDGVAGPRARPD